MSTMFFKMKIFEWSKHTKRVWMCKRRNEWWNRNDAKKGDCSLQRSLIWWRRPPRGRKRDRKMSSGNKTPLLHAYHEINVVNDSLEHKVHGVSVQCVRISQPTRPNATEMRTLRVKLFSFCAEPTINLSEWIYNGAWIIWTFFLNKSKELRKYQVNYNCCDCGCGSRNKNSRLHLEKHGHWAQLNTLHKHFSCR